MKNQWKVLKIIFVIQMVLFGILAIVELTKPETMEAATTFFYEPFRVEATGYDPSGGQGDGRTTFSGKEVKEGVTIAGKAEWVGCVIALYYVDPATGGIGEFYGYREVTDTGYGHASELYPGKGTIETGETVDIFFESHQDAINFGSKQMWIQVIPGNG